MKSVVDRSEWQPAPEFLRQIYSGYNAERKYHKQQRGQAEELARQLFQIPYKDIPSLSQRALDAAVNSLRRTRDPKPDLLKRMVQDQVTVYWLQRKQLNDAILNRYKALARQYIRKHIGLFCRGSLSVDLETVCHDVPIDFLMQIRKPDFVLTSSLPTYLIAILKRQIYALNRPGASRIIPSKAQISSPMVSLETLHYFQHVHRIITRCLSQMDTLCQTIILTHYGIDPQQARAISALPDADQPLSDAEFRERFAVGMGQTGNLKALATELGIDPRQASRKHLTCLDKLIRPVTTELFGESAVKFPDALNDILRLYIEEARQKRQRG